MVKEDESKVGLAHFRTYQNFYFDDKGNYNGGLGSGNLFGNGNIQGGGGTGGVGTEIGGGSGSGDEPGTDVGDNNQNTTITPIDDGNSVLVEVTLDGEGGTGGKTIEGFGLYYKFDAGECVYYIEDGSIKKLVISEYQLQITAKNLTAEKANDRYEIKLNYIKDVHGRMFNAAAYMTLFKTKEEAFEYAMNRKRNNNYNDCLEIIIKYPFDKKVCAFVGTSVKSNLDIVSVIYTRGKSLVTFEFYDKIEYELSDGVETWTVEESKIFLNKEEMEESVSVNDITYEGCDVCKV